MTVELSIFNVYIVMLVLMCDSDEQERKGYDLTVIFLYVKLARGQLSWLLLCQLTQTSHLKRESFH